MDSRYSKPWNIIYKFHMEKDQLSWGRNVFYRIGIRFMETSLELVKRSNLITSLVIRS